MTPRNIDPNSKLALENLGSAYASLGNNELAMQFFEKSKLDSPMAYFNCGFVYASLGRFASALQDFEEMRDGSSSDRPDESNGCTTQALALAGAGYVYSKQKEYYKALDHYATALRRAPRCATTYRLRGNLYFEQSQNKEALGDFNQAIQWDSEFVEAYLDRGKLREKMDDIKAALKDYGQACRREYDIACTRAQVLRRNKHGK